MAEILCIDFFSFQYSCFLDEIRNRVGNEDFLAFPDDEERMFLATPAPEILFTFTKEEWHNFTTALEEANYMREVYRIIQ